MAMRSLFTFLSYIAFLSSFAQTANEIKMENDSVAIVADPKYREDQFYASIAYHSIQNKPTGFSQSSFSTALSIGFLRDMPINKARNHAIAVGLGYSYSNIKNNLKITGVDDVRTYEIIPEDEFDKNKLVMHSVDIPIEFRWRNSDSISHKFWRVYAGFKASYVFHNKAQFEDGSGTIKLRNNPDMNNLLYGVYISAGWNTWNLYTYYGLNPLFDSGVLADNQEVKLNSLNFGLIFYIL